MIKGDYTTLRWIWFWGAVTLVLANSGTDWGLMVSIFTLVLVAGGTGWGIFKWFRHRKWLKNPVVLTYLIPQNSYPAATFVGAPDNQIKPNKLVVGIGTYKILHELTPKAGVLIDALVLRFKGPDNNKPRSHGPDNPFIVKQIVKADGLYYLDWWGDVQPVSAGYPRYIPAGDQLLIGNRVETSGVWHGKTWFEVSIRNERLISMELDFEVTDKLDRNQIPFLRIVGDEAEQKQTI